VGGFLNYLNKMETDFNSDSVEKKEKYIEQIDVDEYYVEEEEQQGIAESESYEDVSIYKKRMVNELFNMGLNKNKINDVIQNVFNEGYNERDVMVEYTEPQRHVQQPQRQLTFKERMQRMKHTQRQQPHQAPPMRMSDKASDILAGVPTDDPYFAPSEMGGYSGGGQQYPPQQQMHPPQQQQQYYGQQQPMPNYNRPMRPQQQMPQGPPPAPAMPMSTINDSNVGSVAVAPQQPMLAMPEGFENYKSGSSEVPIEAQVKIATGIIVEPVGGSIVTKQARQGEIKQGEVHTVNFQLPTQQGVAENNLNAILEKPTGPPPVAPMMGALGGAADHASQLL